MNIGIIGYGWVGKAQHRVFTEAKVYDKFQSEHQTKLGHCDVAFICVPTPWDGVKLDTTEVVSAILDTSSDLYIIRSTVPPGFCDRISKEFNVNVVFQPEYLGESPGHPLLKMEDRSFLILGGSPENRRKAINLYATKYNANVKIRQTTLLESEVIKLSENRAILYKVLQCQELYDVCEAAGVDYYTVRDAVYGDDPRMNLWWTFVYPNNRGANSKCIPKDVYAWSAWAESVGFNPVLTDSMLNYNKSLITK